MFIAVGYVGSQDLQELVNGQARAASFHRVFGIYYGNLRVLENVNVECGMYFLLLQECIIQCFELLKFNDLYAQSNPLWCCKKRKVYIKMAS